MNDSAKPVNRITDLATEECPRERLIHLGLQALATAELLAILLCAGVPGENSIQVRGLSFVKKKRPSLPGRRALFLLRNFMDDNSAPGS